MVIFVVVLVACQNQPQGPKQETASKEAGEQLAKIHCAACHLYPKPTDLDKKTWEKYMLPRMGYMYGYYHSDSVRESLFEKNPGGDIVRASGLFPPKPTLEQDKWEKIQAFYLKNAPDSLTATELEIKKIPRDLTRFKAVLPKTKVSPPTTTMVKFAQDGQLYVGDAMSQKLMLFDQNQKLQFEGQLREGAVSMSDFDNTLWVTIMGSFSPTDNPTGLIISLPKGASSGAGAPIQNLQRPVHSSYADLDGDGLKDVVVCEFGKWTGALSFHRNLGNGQYEKKVLRNTSELLSAL